MIKHLFKQIWAQRAVNAWLWAELIVVSVCLSYVVDYLYTTGCTYFSPLGFNTEHVYRVSMGIVSPASKEYLSGESDSLRAVRRLEVLTRLRTYPGVEAASVSNGSHPYNPSSSSGSRGIDTTWVHGSVYRVSPEFFRVFRVTDKQGRIEPLVSAATQPNAVILSAEGERRFAEAGIQALNAGAKNWGEEEPTSKMTAICSDVRYDDFRSVYPAYYTCKSEWDICRTSGSNVEYCVRVNPDADDAAFFANFRKAMKTQLRLGNLYLLDVTSFDDVRANYFRRTGFINDVKTRMAGLAFLLVNILLGVIGTFWIRTQQRRSEMGLRLALGSSHTALRRLLVGEGLLLLLLAMVPVILIDANVIHFGLLDNEEEEAAFTLVRFLADTGITFGLMALMIVAGILLPARQAMKIQPAEALHEE